MVQSPQFINELKSYTEYNVNTPTSVFTIGFQYEYNVDVVNVYVDGVEATAAGYDIQHDSHGTITLEPAVPSGVVRLARETNIDTSAHTFSAGAKFTAGTMDDNFQQLRHAQQEVRDETVRTAEQFTTLSTNSTAALNAANTAVNTANSIDAKASTALANSNTAVSTANSANSTANTALSTANGIDAKATTALSNSSTALSTANTALSTANGIDAKATQAQQDASTALSTLSNQKGAAGGIASLDANAVVHVEQLPATSTTAVGLIRVATQAEVNTGTYNERAVTPATLKSTFPIQTKSALNASGDAPIYACRAWVKFNATSGTPTIGASGNVSSITDNGIGNYTVNCNLAMHDLNFAASALVLRSSNGFVYETARTTSSISLATKQDDASSFDCEMSVILVR